MSPKNRCEEQSYQGMYKRYGRFHTYLGVPRIQLNIEDLIMGKGGTIAIFKEIQRN